MRSCNSKTPVIFWLSIISLFLTGTVSVYATDTLTTLSRRHPFECAWEPLVPPGFSSNSLPLETGVPVGVRIPRGSGLRLDILSGDPGGLEIFRVYTSAHPGDAATWVPVNRYPSDALSLEIPGDIADPCEFLFRSTAGTMEISLYRYHSVHKPFFWEHLQKTALNQLKRRRFAAEFRALYQTAVDSEDWSFFGLWLRMCAPAVDIAPAEPNPKAFLRDAVADITQAFRILAGEDVYTQPFSPVSETREFQEIADSGEIESSNYCVIPPNLGIPIEGPALLRFSMRVDLPEARFQKMTELPLTVRLDGTRTGHWPDGICRFIHDTAIAGDPVSTNLFQILYIPRGRHLLSFETDRPLYLLANLNRPIFEGFKRTHAPFPVDFSTLVPTRHRRDIAWFNNIFAKYGENPILRVTAAHTRHRFFWNAVEAVGHTSRYLEPSSHPGLYPLTGSSTETTITVPAGRRPDYPSLVHIYDPDRVPASPTPEIILDGHPILVPGYADPFDTSLRTGIMISPGTHTLSVRGLDRNLFLDVPVEGADPLRMTGREYYRIPDNPDNVPVFTVTGGDSGHPLRIHYRSENNDFEVHLDNALWKTIRSHGVRTDGDIYRGFFELTVPPGIHYLECIPVSGSLEIAVRQPGWIDSETHPSIQRDPFLETLIRHLDTPPDFETIQTRLTGAEPDSLDKIFWLAMGTDFIRARTLLLDTVYDETVASHRMLLSWLYFKTGYNHRALETAWPLVDDPSMPYCHAFYQALLNAAVSLGDAYRPVILSERILAMEPNDTMALAVKNNLSGTSEATASLTLDQMIRSPSPRFLPIPADRMETDGRMQILEDPTQPDRETPPSDRSHAVYWQLAPAAGTDDRAGYLQFNLPKPAILRCTVRGVSELPDDLSYETVVLGVHHNNETRRIELPLSPTGGSVHLFYPVSAPGRVRIECLEGPFALSCSIQVPGIADRIRPASGQPVLSRYMALLDTRLDDPAQLAEVLDLQKKYPDVYLFQSLADILDIRFRTRLLSGWPEPPYHRRYIRFTGLKHRPVTLLRSLDVPEPLEDFPALIFTRNQQAQFRPELPRTGSVHCVASGFEENNYRIRVEIDRRTVGELSPDQPFLDIPWDPLHNKTLYITAMEVDGGYPVKIAVFYQKKDRKQVIPLYGNRRYYAIHPSLGSSMNGRIIGPVCLKLECRSMDPAGEPCELAVTATDPQHQTVFSERFAIPAVRDTNAVSVPDNKPVSREYDILVPLPGKTVYNVSVQWVSGKTPGIIRPYARVPKSSVPGADEPTGAEVSAIEMNDETGWDENLPPATAETAVSAEYMEESEFNEPGIHFEPAVRWNTFMDDSGEPKTHRWGVLGLGLHYRNRDRNPDDDVADAFEVYAGDGAGGVLTWNRRIDFGSGEHRLYLDTEAGGTRPSEVPDNAIFHAFQTTTWYMGDSGFRGRFHGSAATQSLDGNSEARFRVRAEVRRTFRLSPRWTTMAGIGGFWNHQTLASEDLATLPERPPPEIYTDFDDRRESGAYLISQLNGRLTPGVSVYFRFRTLTAGDGESGVLGPWWARGGIRMLTGPIVLGAYYEERRTFGDSPEADRSRLEVHATVYRWIGENHLWSLSLRDRYTFDTEWNDVYAALTVRFNAAGFLREFDPNRFLYRDRINSLRD